MVRFFPQSKIPPYLVNEVCLYFQFDLNHLLRPVSELKQLIDSLLIEYLVSTDLAEAERCVRELRTPLFHHEMVKRFMVIAVDKDSTAQTAVASLLEHLVRAEVLSPEQLRKGLEKFHSKLDDLALDAPCAPRVLEFFCKDVLTTPDDPPLGRLRNRDQFLWLL